MNNIKRIFSCFSLIVICLLANMGIEAKAVTSSPIATIKQNKEPIAQAQQFTLHNGITQSETNQKIADHYSHYSHSSHHSHYSSRY
jgi:purine-nucleoside phosphorylase